jgi:hypothetical protein
VNSLLKKLYKDKLNKFASHLSKSLLKNFSKGATRTYQMAKGCNDTSNILTLPLALRRGRHKPLTITGGGQEQSPTLANASKLL